MAAYGFNTNYNLTLTDEYVYLAGARYLKETGSLNSRYYDPQALLRQGYPHKDHHAPGYMILLAGAMALAGSTQAAAIGLNVIAYFGAAFLIRGLARRLGLSETASLVSALAFLVLPAYLAYVFWTLSEVLVGTLLLATLYGAIRFGDRVGGAAATALVFGAGFVVRESILFGLPAVLLLLRGRRQLATFAGVAVLWMALVYAPLVRGRAEGGANFWSPAPMPGSVLNNEALRAAREGRIGGAAVAALGRAGENLVDLLKPGAITERTILAVYAFLPLLAAVRWRALSSLQRRYAAGLLVGWLGLVTALFTAYAVMGWAGFRYTMFLMPAFLPLVMVPLDQDRSPGRWVIPSSLMLMGLALVLGTFQILTPFKGMRRGATGPRQQAKITSYVDQYVGTEPLRCIILPHGFQFGLAHYPVEVVWDAPRNTYELHLLERMMWFDYVILPGDAPLGVELDERRRRYQRMNPGEREPPLRIFKRLTGQHHLRDEPDEAP
jgi:4-amino-4-deoxy-L-arabinose transferase-like glycosyltransferase